MLSKNVVLASSLAVIALVGSYFALRTSGPAAPEVKTAAAPVAAPQKPAEPPRPVFIKPKAGVAAQPVVKDDAPRTRPLRRKAKSLDAGQAAAAQGLAASPRADGQRPEESTAAYRPENAAVSPAKIARREKNFSNPMDGRWVKTLSGGNAKVDMGKKSVKAGNCSETRDCERKPAPEQAWVAGVVVTTERLEASPADPVDGKLAKGHYLDDTPGVYVK